MLSTHLVLLQRQGPEEGEQNKCFPLTLCCCKGEDLRIENRTNASTHIVLLQRQGPEEEELSEHFSARATLFV